MSDGQEGEKNTKTDSRKIRPFWYSDTSNTFALFFVASDLHSFHTIRKGFDTGEPYDYRSVVHYDTNYLREKPYYPVIMKKMPGGPVINHFKELSELDARKVNKFFGCPVPKSEYNFIEKFTA